MFFQGEPFCKAALPVVVIVVEEIAHVDVRVEALIGVNGRISARAVLLTCLTRAAALFGAAALLKVLPAQSSVTRDEHRVYKRERDDDYQQRDDPALAEYLAEPLPEVCAL